ncbi:MAG: hypothetical protein CW345_07300 [Firmicutes bacterium]|nr:hypothetical protein [Bacillota bacterium]
MSRLRRDPPAAVFREAVEFLEAQGFKLTLHRFGPKTRVDLSWPDDRRGVRLPEWRVVEIADEVRRLQREAAPTPPHHR